MYDARQILTQTLYDNLNRATSITYSDGVTPGVDNFYDSQGFTVSGDNRTVMNKGQLGEVRTAALGSIPATSQLANYDLMGREFRAGKPSAAILTPSAMSITLAAH